MLKKTLILVACLAAISGCAGVKTPSKTYRSISDTNVHPGQPFPKFELPDANGAQLGSDSLLGKFTVISFFTEGCAPCLHEIPVLNSFKKSHPQFNVLAISPDRIEDVKSYPTKYNLVWPIVANGENYVFNILGIKAFPSFALVDSQGILVATTYGNQLGEDAYVSEKGLSDWVTSAIKTRKNVN